VLSQRSNTIAELKIWYEGHQKTKKIDSSYDPAIIPLGIYLKEYNSTEKRDTCTPYLS
jgi:hypothetical protein